MMSCSGRGSPADSALVSLHQILLQRPRRLAEAEERPGQHHDQRHGQDGGDGQRVQPHLMRKREIVKNLNLISWQVWVHDRGWVSGRVSRRHPRRLVTPTVKIQTPTTSRVCNIEAWNLDSNRGRENLHFCGTLKIFESYSNNPAVFSTQQSWTLLCLNLYLQDHHLDQRW